MRNRFLVAKHWQLFLVVFLIPISYTYQRLVHFFTIFKGTSDNWSGETVQYAILLVPFAALLLYLYWLWAIGKEIQDRISPSLKSNTLLFKFLISIPIVYLSFLFLMLGTVLSGAEIPPRLVSQLIIAFIPMKLLYLICMIGSIRFVGRSIDTMEFNRRSFFTDYISNFLLISFFPIGVWFIQPRINKLIAENKIGKDEFTKE